MLIGIIHFRNKRAYEEIIVEHYKDPSIKGPYYTIKPGLIIINVKNKSKS